MSKKFYQVMTPAVKEHYSLEQTGALLGAFQNLKRAFPKEYHFTIGLASANNGEGEKVWFIIDDSEEEHIETMLFPEDY